MKKSLIVSWISNCDYPIFRLWLRKYGLEFFDEVIIYWDVNFRYPFFQAFIQSDLSWSPKIKFLDPVDKTGLDWRQVSTTELVKHATGDWIASIEQDFFVQNWEILLTEVQKSMEKNDLIGWMNPTNAPYIHPSLFFIKREMFEKTSKDFSAHPEINGSDHFAMITYDAQKLGAKIDPLPFDFNYSQNAFGFHLGGVNQNYLNGLTEGFEFHRPESFSVYNFKCRQVDIPQDIRFMELSLAIEEKLVPITVHNEWNKFFDL